MIIASSVIKVKDGMTQTQVLIIPFLKEVIKLY
jgi:hypothetical protein